MSDDLPNPEAILSLHKALTRKWHESPGRLSVSDPFLALVEKNHLRNFTLWHHEDDARREDKGFEFVYRAKRAIDRNNQERNDFIEKMDKHLYALFGDGFSGRTPMNSETPGSIIDRLSIMALKQYHMREEVDRTGVGDGHIAKCAQKLEVIEQQIRDLGSAFANLLDECRAGTRGFRVYFQFKMYNDPELNPALYKKS